VSGVPIAVDDRLVRLPAVFSRHPSVVAAYLHGSYGTAAQTPLSDVDVAVVHRPGSQPDHEAHLRLVGEVIDALAEDDVSVTNLNRAPVVLQFKVLEGGRLLYCSDPVSLADFQEQVFKRHGDFVIDYREFLKEYDQAAAEAYRDG